MEKEIDLKTIEDVNRYIRSILQPSLILLQEAINFEDVIYLIPMLQIEVTPQKEEFEHAFDCVNRKILVKVNLTIRDKLGNVYSKIDALHMFTERILNKETINVFINDFKCNVLKLIIHQEDVFYSESQSIGNMDLKSAYKVAKILYTNSKMDLNNR